MDCVQSILNTTIFAERFTQPNTAFSETAGHLHTAFWEDSYNRNLRLEHVEIEFRLGKCPTNRKGCFNTSIPEQLFKKMMECLQSYNNWDEATHKQEIVAYFPKIDQSVRHVIANDGTTTTTSKQKILQADFVGKDLPLDFRLAVNIELPLQASTKYTLQTAERIVNRTRSSFSIDNVRYDLTRIVEDNGTVDYQVELELINVPTIQLKEDSTQSLTLQIQSRLIEIMNSIEPIRSFHIELLRKRSF